jgi:hypothetical protein
MSINLVNLVIILCIFILIIVIIYYINKSSVKNLKLPDGTLLIQKKSFYDNFKNDTLKYLISVYPTASDSFNKMSSEQLAIFYNSLWFYYNCEASFNDNIPDQKGKNTKYCWQELPGCGTKFSKLPYTPQGYLYSFQDWIKNIWTPWIKSNSDKPPSYFTGSIPGITLWIWLIGPSQLFTPQRAIVRQVYNTSLPEQQTWFNIYNDQDLIVAKIPQIDPDVWSSEWNYPNNWWLGSKSNSYIEVTYTDVLEYGSSMIWWNAAPGSGIFLNVGNVKIARNKVDALYKLVKEMSQTSDGSDKLKEWYYSDDPYIIISNFFTTPCRQEGAYIWDPINKTKIKNNFCTGNQTSFIGIPNSPGGWDDLRTFEANDWYTWCGKISSDPNKPWAYNLPNECIDNVITGKTYLADRINALGNFDEAIFAVGSWLNYDVIQMTHSSNGTGFYQIEMLELRGYDPAVKNRDYSSFLQYNEQDKTVSWRLDNGVVEAYMNNIMKFLSQRDPTDVMNDSKATACVASIPWIDSKNNPSWTWTPTCKDSQSEMLNKLSLNGANNMTPPAFNQCTDGIGFGGNPMTDLNSPPFG